MSGKTEKKHRKMACIMYGSVKGSYVSEETGDYATVDHTKMLKKRWKALNNAGRKVISAAITAEIERTKTHGNPMAETPKHRKF